MKFSERLLDDIPANDWNSAYPLGNGSMGVMVDGGIRHEQFYMNDDTFWAGNGENRYRYNNVFDKVRELAMAKQYNEASNMLWKDVYGEYAESYLPLCTLHVERNIDALEGYERALDLSTAVHNMKTKRISEQCIVSHRDKVFALRIESDRETAHTFRVTADVRYSVATTSKDRGATIEVKLEAPSHNDPVGHPTDTPVVYDEERPGLKAYAETRIETDGIIMASGSSVKVEKCTYIYVLFAETTSMRDEDITGSVRAILDSAEAKGIDDILVDHVMDYKSLYDRVEISLTDRLLSESLTTRDGLKRYSKHPEMVKLLFNYGRYLMISGSREDSHCMNLQGIWNAEFKPPWSSAYTVNINIEMNYWIAETTGLSECHMPLMRQLKVLEKSGRQTAKNQLHSEGWCCGHNSDIWGHSDLTGRISHFDPTMYALYISGGAWLATHIYTHYLYTGDIEFLREYYYILRGAAEFYLSYMRQDNESEYMVLCPGSSPENTFKMGKIRSSLSKNSTMDASIARHIFRIVERCGEILGEDEEFCAQCKDARERLYPLKVGKHGELLEWYENYNETEKSHRHISHLYALYPDSDISMEETPDLINAAKKTLKRRGDRGNIGWSLAWKMCFYARLYDGKNALRELSHKLRYYDPKKGGLNYGGCYANLFSAPPMQIDGNFGATAGIVEMLLQSHHGINILPAIPKEWTNGSFRGLRAEGGYAVDCTWSEGRVTRLTIHGEGDTVAVRVNGEMLSVALNEEISLS